MAYTSPNALPYATLAQPECVCAVGAAGANGPLGGATTPSGPYGCAGRVNSNAHPAQHAADGDPVTFWQSWPRFGDPVSFAMDLEVATEVSEMSFLFNGPAPAEAVLEKSLDGVTWTTHHQFAVDCAASFNATVGGQSSNPAAAACSTVPVPSSELTFTQPLDGLHASDRVLQQWITFRYVRLTMTLYAPDAIMSQRQYAIRDILVLGRGACNGTATSTSFLGPVKTAIPPPKAPRDMPLGSVLIRC